MNYLRTALVGFTLGFLVFSVLHLLTIANQVQKIKSLGYAVEHSGYTVVEVTP